VSSTTTVRRTARRAAIWALLLTVISSLCLAGTSTPAKAAGEGAVEEFGGCLVAQKAGDVLVIIDESLSLEQNDPDNARITAAKYLLTQLSSFAERTKVTLDVSVAGFSHNYAEAQDWTSLDANGLKSTTATIDSFANRPKGFETDYWMALEGARRSLADHNPKGDRCQALVWISDGELDVDWRRDDNQRNAYGDTKPYLPGEKLNSEAVAKKAEAEAERQICRNGGLADQLRSSKVTVFGVGLRGKDNPDYKLMKSISLGGDAGGMHCGKITKPPGSFTEASDIDQLLFEFDKIATPNQEKKETQAGVCQGKPCPEQRHTFVLDDSVQSVHILGSSDVEKAEVYLVSTDDTNVQLPRKGVGETASADVGQVKINYSWQSDRTIVIDMAAGGAGTKGWSGPWSVVFVDPSGTSPGGKSRTSIAISGDVFPTWPKAKETSLRSGDSTQVQLGLVNADGDAIEVTKLLGKVAMDVSFEGPDGQTVEVAKGLDKNGIAQPVTLDLTKTPAGAATLVLKLSITTADAKNSKGQVVPGTQLQPQTVRIPLQVVAPAGFPTLGQQVNFGTHEGKAEGVPGTLTVTGPGCVWVEGNGSPNILAGPESIGEVSIASTHNSAATCLKVDEGQTAELPLTLTTTGVDNGTLNAEFIVKIAPKDDPSKVRDATVLGTASFEKPLNPVNFTLTLIVAAILGPGLPLLLLYIMKFVTSKIPGRALTAEEFPVTVEAGQVLRDGQRFELKDRDLTSGMVPLSNSGSRTAQAGSATLNAKMGGSPFGVGYVEVETPGRIGASSSDTRPHGKNLAARLPLNVHNNWVLLHDPNGPADQATVLMLVGADAPTEVREKLVDDVNSRVPEVLEALRAQAGVPVGVGAGAPGSPFGGGDGGQPGGPGGPAPFDFGPDMPGGMPGGPGGDPFGGARPPMAGPVGAPPMGGGAPMGQAPMGQAPMGTAPTAGTPVSAASANPFDQGQGAPYGQPSAPPQWGQPAEQAPPQWGQPAEQAPPQQAAPTQGQPQQGWEQQPPQPPVQQQWGQPADQQLPPQQGQPQQGWEQQPAQPPMQQPPMQQPPMQQPPAPQPPEQWGQPAQQQGPQPGWGTPEQQVPQQQAPQQPAESQPSGQPSADEFRPAAPPPGTTIQNPFEFGDNSGR